LLSGRSPKHEDDLTIRWQAVEISAMIYFRGGGLESKAFDPE